MATENKTEKKKDEKGPYKAEEMGTETIAIVATREPFGGANPSEVVIDPSDRDRVYLIDGGQFAADLKQNGRLVYDVAGMAAEIRRDGGVLTPLTVAVFTKDPGGLTLADISPEIAKAVQGHRRFCAIKELIATDEEFASKFLVGRIPVKFVVNPSPEELLRLRHDHSGQKGLSEAEVLNQAVHLIRGGMSEARTIEILWNSIVASKPASKRVKMVELDAAYAKKVNAIKARVDSGEISAILAKSEVNAALAELWKGRKDWGRRFIQTASRLEAVTTEVFDYMMLGWMPELALERGLNNVIKITTGDFDKLGDEAKDLRKKQAAGTLTKDAVDKAINEMFEKLIADRTPVVADEDGNVEGEPGESEGPTKGRSLSRKELEQQAAAFSSERLKQVFLGIAGDLKARESWAEVDAILTAIEAATNESPETLEAFLTDPSGILLAYDDQSNS